MSEDEWPFCSILDNHYGCSISAPEFFFWRGSDENHFKLEDSFDVLFSLIYYPSKNRVIVETNLFFISIQKDTDDSRLISGRNMLREVEPPQFNVFMELLSSPIPVVGPTWEISE